MSRVLTYAPRVAIFLAGVAAAALTRPRRERGGMDPAALEDLKKSLAGLELRIQSREAAEAERGAVNRHRRGDKCLNVVLDAGQLCWGGICAADQARERPIREP